MAERTTKVRLSAEVQQYVDGMQQAAKATRETGSEAEKLAKQGEAFTLLGRASMVAGGAVVAGLTMATKAAIDWESAWAGVTKTVDGSPEQLEAIEQGLRDLTGVLPASHAEIAAVAEAAGQLGIETPNVVAFTKTMIDLGETTNLSAEEAAMSLARFVNIMGTAQEDVSKLGSALVGLGNNYATTESEILEMSMRLAKSGVQIGLTEGEVLGLATSLSSVGIEAEAGGSAMSKVMIDIAASVETGSDKLELFAKASGMSAQEFSQKWKTAPAEALAAFVKGLANAEQQGNSTLGVLAELGITEVRMRDALLGSAAAADDFAGAMAMGNKEFEANNALTAEAEKRYETTAAKFSIMWNKITDAAIGIGEQFLPMVEGGAKAVGDFADAISGLDGPMESVVAWGGLLIGTGLLGAGVWFTAIPKIAEYKAALVSLELAGGRLVRTMSAVGKIGGAVAAWSVLISLAAATEADVTKLSNAFERNADAQTLMQEAAEANANRGLGSLTAGMQDISLTSEEVINALQNQRKEWSDFWDYLGDATHQAAIKEDLSALSLLGDELARIAGTDLSKLQSGLSGLADEFGFTDDDMWSFIENSGDLKEALETQAGALGLSTEKADLLKIAFGEVGPAADDATDATGENADALAQLQGKAAATEGAIDDLADAIRGFGSAELDAREANRRLEESFDDLADAVAENGSTLDIGTEQGRANEAAIDAVARATLEAAAATLQQTADQEAANAVLAGGRDRLIEMLAQFGITGAAADEYVRRLGLIPENIATYATVSTEQAEADLQYFTRDRYIRIGTWLDSSGNERIDNWAFGSANGNMFAYANGGMESYANGGFPTGIYAGGPPIHKFAEPETLWEAYISGKPSERDRNRQIWSDAGERLGMGEQIGKAIEQGLSAAKGGNSRPGTVINYTSVNPVVRDDFGDAWQKAQERGAGW